MTFPKALQNPKISLFLFCFVLFFVCTLSFNSNLYSQSTNIFAGKTYDAGISFGFVGSGEVDMDFDPYVTKRTSSFLVKANYDSYLIPKLAMGLYFQVAAAPVDMHYTEHRTDSDYIDGEWVYTNREIEHSQNLDVMTWEIGVSIKPRYFVGQNIAIKPGLNIGYRKFYFNEDDLENVGVLQWFEDEDQKPEAAGMAVNGSLEVQYHFAKPYYLFGEFGFLTQPYGGTRHVTDLQFGPVMYLTVGLAL